MKKLLIPFLFLLVGTGSGVGAAFLLKSEEPAIETATETCAPSDSAGHTIADAADHMPESLPEVTEFAKLNNQFVVPVVSADRIAAMVVISLSIEVAEGNKEVVFQAEPKIRNSFLQVMFDHANIGGFSGNFTSATNMRILRQDLLRSARLIIGENAMDVLILDIVRQDI